MDDHTANLQGIPVQSSKISARFNTLEDWNNYKSGKSYRDLKDIKESQFINSDLYDRALDDVKKLRPGLTPEEKASKKIKEENYSNATVASYLRQKGYPVSEDEFMAKGFLDKNGRVLTDMLKPIAKEVTSQYTDQEVEQFVSTLPSSIRKDFEREIDKIRDGN